MRWTFRFRCVSDDRLWRKAAVHAPVATTKLAADRQIEHGAGTEEGSTSTVKHR
jgi:hypothetical protein